MPPKGNSLWENSALLRELSIALFDVASKNGALTQESKNAVQNYLQAAGYSITWDAIR